MQHDNGPLFDAHDEYVANEMVVRHRPGTVIVALADGRLLGQPYVGKEGRKIGKGLFGPRIGALPPSLELTLENLSNTLGPRGTAWELIHDGAEPLSDTSGLDDLVARFRAFQQVAAPGIAAPTL